MPRPPPRLPIVSVAPILARPDPSNDVPTEPAPERKAALRAVSSQEANVILGPSEAEMRARLEREVLAVLRTATDKMRPDRGAALRWALVGACAGAMLVYVFMASALHQRDILVEQLSSRPAPAPISTVASVLSPPPAMTCPASSGDAILSAIPTVDVEQLPKTRIPVATHRAHAPRPTQASSVDEENPYENVTAE